MEMEEGNVVFLSKILLLLNASATHFKIHHKRKEEGDQEGPWTPLEGPKSYLRRSQNLSNFLFSI